MAKKSKNKSKKIERKEKSKTSKNKSQKVNKKSKKKQKISPRKFPTLKLLNENDIAIDFATKVYNKFDKMAKSIILFGSSVKNTATAGSDIDIIIVLDDASIKWDQELIAWYREELGKLIMQNPYKKELHINSVKLTTWWQDLLRGDTVIINILRYGEPLIDFGGFFMPLKILLQQGKIKSTPEAIYTALQRAPGHISRSKASELNSIEGVYWAMVDSSHAALMATGETPPSPEHIPIMLKEKFADRKLLKMRYIIWYRDLYILHRKIVHGQVTDLKGTDIDDWQKRADEFVRVMAELVKKIIS